MTPNADRKPQDMARPVSTEIGWKGTQTHYYAEKQAENIGLPLNTKITLNFDLTSIQPWDATAAFGKWRTQRFNKWARRPCKGRGKAFEPTYAYVFENKKDPIVYNEIGEGLPHNVHVHMYAHIPAERLFDFSGRAYEWLDEMAGPISAQQAVKIQWVTEDNGVMQYDRKGASKAAAKRYGVKDLQCPQGMIIGRRSGTSLNLGPTARKATDKELGIIRYMPSSLPLGSIYR